MTWPTTARFDTTIGHSHFVVVRAEILEDDDVIFDVSGERIVFEGSVTASRSEIQRQAQLTLVDKDGTIAPDDVQDLFMPSGRQIRLWRGVVYPDATRDEAEAGEDREMVPLGTFRYTVTESTYPTVKLDEMFDRAWIVQGAGFEKTYTIAKSTQYDDAIRAILWQAYPNVPVDLPDTDEVTKLMTFDMGSDPWEVCQQLAANLGMRLYFDPMGTCVMRNEPDIQTDPIVWSFDDTDKDNFALGGLTTTWQGQAYNSVIVIAENSDLAKPLRAIAQDLDPNSPTKYGGLYGKRLAPIVRDEKITKQSQADARARHELETQLGLFQKVKIPSLVIPQLEVADLLYAFDTKRLKIGAKFVVDSFEVPLRGTAFMPIESRARQVTSVEYAPGALAGLTLDSSAPVIATNAVNTTIALTCASFTPPAGSMILVHWIGDEPGGSVQTSATITDSIGLTWNTAKYRKWSAGQASGQVGFWWAIASGAALTITVSNNAVSGQRCAAMKVYVILGADAADPIGATGAGSYDTSTLIDESYSAQRTGSWGFMGIFDDDGSVASTISAGSECTLDGTALVATDMVYAFDRRTNADGVGGSTTHLRANISNSHFYAFALVEILPAVA